MIGRLANRLGFIRDHLWTNAHISAYLDRELSGAEAVRIERHARACPNCRRMLETLQRTLEGLRAMSAAGQPSGLADSVVERLRAPR